MEENHQREQYFFDEGTVHALADMLMPFDRPCTLCAPLVGRELARRKRPVHVLDIDERFASVPGFQRWDLFRPTHLPEPFDVILCDPPFFNVSLSQLFTALRLLCHFDLSRRIVIGYLVRREDALLAAFVPFGLRPTACYPAYRTVKACGRNDIQLYANFDLPPSAKERLASAHDG